MIISQSDFEKAFNEVQKYENYRWYCWQRARALLKAGYDFDAYNIILLSWNFAYHRYLMKKFDYKKFINILEELEPHFKSLDEIAFQSVDLKDNKIQEKIKFIYIKLRDIVKQTGATKVMALRNPKLFVMWDTKIRNAYKINDEANPEDYIKFLTKIKEVFGHIKWEHDSKPFAKAIDEYNYFITNE